MAALVRLEPTSMRRENLGDNDENRDMAVLLAMNDPQEQRFVDRRTSGHSERRRGRHPSY
jgi:hypothetical protein